MMFWTCASPSTAVFARVTAATDEGALPSEMSLPSVAASPMSPSILTTSRMVSTEKTKPAPEGSSRAFSIAFVVASARSDSTRFGARA
jgi:hypothetical protein